MKRVKGEKEGKGGTEGLGRLLGGCTGRCSGGGSWSGCRGRGVVGLVVGWLARLVISGVNAAVVVVLVKENSSRSQSFYMGFVVE